MSNMSGFPRPLSAAILFVALLSVTLWTPCLPAEEAPPSAVGPLLKLYQSDRLPAERQPAVVEMICNRGNEHDLRVVFERLVKPEGMPANLQLKVLGWLTQAHRTRKVKPTGELDPLTALIKSKDEALRTAAVQLAADWQLAAVAPTLQQIAADPDATPELQKVAIRGLVALQGAGSKETLVKLASSGATIAGRMQAVAALTTVDLPTAAQQAAAVLAAASPQDDPAPVLDAFFDRKEGSKLLAAALESQKLTVDNAKRSLRYMYSVGRSDAELSGVLSKAAGVAADPAPPTPEEVARLVQEVTAKGDPVRGEMVFRRNDLSCLRCHSLNRAGGQVGPELGAVGGSSPLDYIINSVLNPNLAVKEQYVTRVFETSDGKVLTGIVIDRDESRVRIRDSQSKELLIPTADIEDEVEGRSIMPNGLTKFLTHDELLDLVAFVAGLGKPGTYAVRTAPIVQRWQVLANPPAELTSDVPHLEHLRQHVLAAPPEAWTSAYAMFNGELPLSELRQGDEPKVVILRGEVEVTEAGPVEFDIASTETVQVWVDAQSIDPRSKVVLPLDKGRHAIVVRVQISGSQASTLKATLGRPEGSAAQFEIVGGS